MSAFPKKVLVNKGKPLIKLACHRDNLPEMVGIDWSFPNCWTWAANKSGGEPALSDPEVLLEVVKNHGVLVVYERIQAKELRICRRASPDSHPSTWLQLSASELKDVLVLMPDIQGNVSI